MMAYYEWKRIRDLLIKADILDETSNPIDTKKYGNNTSVDMDGNIHTMTADYIKILQNKIMIYESYVLHLKETCIPVPLSLLPKDIK